ncbi:mitochondrial outer membrane protein IML2 [Coprinopsis sp. MPI-PUGE-AT-0042]|nr:mitochondrial outer membrane protein IML2 [Coprinopsis sp. MPI-PUGE-AT-0042]
MSPSTAPGTKDEHPPHPSAEMLASATKGFDLLFSNDIVGSRDHFGSMPDDPFHLMGSGVCAFLEAALGMETNQMTEASRCLALSETGARKQMKAPKAKAHSRFPVGLEWEIINADAIVLLGLTHALSETYMGYLQCMYSLNNAHSKFTKLYKAVFPNGIDDATFTAETTHSTVTASLPVSQSNVTLQVPTTLSHKSSQSSLASVSSVSSATSGASVGGNALAAPAARSAAPSPTKSFFGRWLGSSAAAASSEPSLPLHPHQQHPHRPDGPVEDLIVAGTAFGYGLFNLVFSLLPKKVQGLVGFLGFQHDRKLALKALSLSARKQDVHGVFSGFVSQLSFPSPPIVLHAVYGDSQLTLVRSRLVLMTYYGVVLLLSGWQADESKLINEVRGIIDRVEARYPEGALWILNRGKLLRMSGDAEGSIRVLKNGLKPERPHSFAQADMMLLFELAWTLLGQREYKDSADSFLRITEINTWSHATYYFLSAGCYFSLGDITKCQELLDAIPGLIDKKKVGGKDLPTEVFIKKKLAFYKEKQKRRGGDPDKYAEAIRISPAEELAIFWNTHSRVDKSICRAHIADVVHLTPALTIKSETITELLSTSSSNPNSSELEDLDNPEELAVRALLLGICHRTLEEFEPAMQFLHEARRHHASVQVNTWVGGIAMFELAVLQLKQVEWREKTAKAEDDGPNDSVNWKAEWLEAIQRADVNLDEAASLSPNTVDLSGRLDSRVSMLRDEMASKKELLAKV